MLCTMPCGGGTLQKGAGGWKLHLTTDPDPFPLMPLQKPNPSLHPKQDRGCARQSWQLEEGAPGAGLNPTHCQGNLGSGSRPRKPEPAMGQEHNRVHGGRGQIISRQPAGNARSWQRRLAGRIMAQNRAGSRGTPVQGLHHQPGGRGPGLVGSKEGGCLAAGRGMAATLTLALLCLQRLQVRSQKAYGST